MAAVLPLDGEDQVNMAAANITSDLIALVTDRPRRYLASTSAFAYGWTSCNYSLPSHKSVAAKEDCEYCGTISSGDRCASCGAPRRAKWRHIHL